MKKLFILAAAIVALASCSKEPETIVNDGSIKFANLETRTTVTNAESLNAGFTVLGYADAVTIFDNEETSKNGSYWTTESKKYWADNTTYNFFAAYPKHDLTGGANQASASLVFKNEGEEDLVLAGRQVVTLADGKGRGAAQLVFKHALSRVKFNFTNGFSSPDTEVKVDVSGLQLVGEAKTGTVTITSTNNADDIAQKPELGTSTSAITWASVTSSGNINYMVDFKTPTITEGVSSETDYKYIIPATNQEYKLIGTIKVYDETATIREYVFNESNPLVVKVIDAEKQVTKSVLTHEAGKSYTYNMTISASLNEITFTVTVEEWADGNGEDGENIQFPGN